MFMVLFVLNLPFLRVDVVEQSRLREPILNSSPILSNVAHNANNAISDIYKLEKNFMEAFCHDEYNDFVDFENEIMELTGSRRFD